MRSHWFLAALVIGASAPMLSTTARAEPASPPSEDASKSQGPDSPEPVEDSKTPSDEQESTRRVEPAPKSKRGVASEPGPQPRSESAPSDEPRPEPPPGSGDDPRDVDAAEPAPKEKRELPFDAKRDESEAAGTVDVGHPQAQKLHLDEAIRLALSRHPQLITAQERVKAARSKIGQAQSSYYPQIDGTLQYVRASENGSLASFHSIRGMSRVGGSIRDGVRTHHSFNNFLAAVAVQQALYDFGRTQGAVAAERARVKAAQMEAVLTEQTVTFGVVRAFYDVQAARAGVEVAQDLLTTARGVHELAATAKQAGMRSPSEQARAEADVAAAEVRLIRAQAELDLARNRVAFAIGAVGEAYEPVEQPLPMDGVPSQAECIATALEHRPELDALDFERQGLKQDLRSTKARQYPRIDALASVNSRGQFLPAADQDPYQRFNWNAGIVISIPIFQGLLIKKQKEEIRAELDALAGGQEAIRQAVILEVQQALARVRAADAAEKASRKGVRAAEEALETLQERYAGGLASLVELTDIQDAYLSARSQAVQAAYDRYLARAVLSLAMGTPIGTQ